MTCILISWFSSLYHDSETVGGRRSIGYCRHNTLALPAPIGHAQTIEKIQTRIPLVPGVWMMTCFD